MPQIYVINGYPGSGKTTFGEITANILESSGQSFLHTSSITLVKNLLKEDLQSEANFVDQGLWDRLVELKRLITEELWDGATKDEKWRGFMSLLKDRITETYPTLLHEYVVRHGADRDVVYVDIREPDNILGFIEYCRENHEIEVQTIFIESDTREFANNRADTSVEAFDYHHKIKNLRNGEDSLEQFTEIVRIFCKECILLEMSDELDIK